MGRDTDSIGIDRVIELTPRPLSKTVNTVVESITISMVLSIPLCVIVLILCGSITIDSNSMTTVVDFVNDAG